MGALSPHYFAWGAMPPQNIGAIQRTAHASPPVRSRIMSTIHVLHRIRRCKNQGNSARSMWRIIEFGMIITRRARRARSHYARARLPRPFCARAHAHGCPHNSEWVPPPMEPSLRDSMPGAYPRMRTETVGLRDMPAKLLSHWAWKLC